VIAAIDESGQQKTGTATAGVKRHCMGCAGRVANGSCTQLRESLEEHGQAYVPRVASNFTLTLARARR
jgi:hypothetical protein